MAAWRRLLFLYAASVLVLSGATAALLLALDPLDSGHFALFGNYGVPRLVQRLTGASLGRQRDMDTALIGNSTVQLLEPARIDAASGHHTVLLSMPRTTPLEHLALADWFRRHHPGASFRALVLGIDASWCRGDGLLEIRDPFPFWLYSESRLDYVRGMLRLKSIEWAERKVKLLLGQATPARRDGYADFEVGRVWDAVRVKALREADAEAPPLAAPRTNFAAVPRLRRFLALLPATTRVVLIVPPRHRLALPPPGSALSTEQEACNAAYAALAVERPGTRLINFLGRSDMMGDDDYWDLIHYRNQVARAMEPEIAAALAGE